MIRMDLFQNQGRRTELRYQDKHLDRCLPEDGE